MSGPVGTFNGGTLSDVVEEMRAQLATRGTVDPAHLHRLLGDNRKGVSLQTNSEFRVSNLASATMSFRATERTEFFLPGV